MHPNPSTTQGTISRRLMLLATVSVTLALLLTCSVFAAYGIMSLHNAKSQQLTSQARLLALNSAAAVEFNDSVQADRLLAALQVEPSVKSAGLFSSDGKLVGRYPSDGDVGSLLAGMESQPVGHQLIERPIVSDGETVGRLKLVVDFKSLRTAMWNYGLLTLVVGTGAWGVAICVAFLLQRGIIRPIIHLAHVAKKIADDGDYTLRVEGEVNGELGDMYRAFNGMLAQIQLSNHELEDAYEHLEQRVNDRTKELAKALDVAESASRSKSDFLANMSHEIRTPLNAIMGYADLLRRGWVDSSEERDDMLATIHTSGRHLMTVINDILDLSKIESGRLELELRSESPHQVLSEVVSLMRVSFREKNLTLDYNWDGPVPKQIETDTVRLRQILINLVGNARKFTPSGGVQLIAGLHRDSQSSRLVIEVVDTGVGIPLDKQSQVFEPFVQADTSVTRKFGGTGLGLSISRRLARLLGGDLTVSSEPGKGSNFQLSIPCGDLKDISFYPAGSVGDVIPQRSATAEKVTLTSQLHGMRVLVVDDGFTNRKLISLILSRSGVEITEAEDGQEACNLVLSGRPFDAILLDMQMPVMDGYAAARKLRNSGVVLPIVALTAHAMKGDREKCVAAGCSDFLSKPVGAESLLELMTSIYSRRSTVAAVTPDLQPIYSKLPTDDLDFAEIVVDFIPALKREVTRLAEAVRHRDPVATMNAAHWIKGSGGTAGFPCFSGPAFHVCEAVRNNNWSEIDRHLIAIVDFSDRVQAPEIPATV